MTTQKEKAEIFTRLHVKGDPVILFNVWNAGTAKAVADAGAKAIATGSWSVAAANGYTDAEEIPLDAAVWNIERIAKTVDLPVTLDFEGGYAVEPNELKANIARVIDAGAIGINFEEQIIGGEGLYSIEEQSARIAAIREAADEKGIPLFINARTDLFLKNLPADDTDELVEQAVQRAEAYAAAGASGLFAPGLRNADLIKTLCEHSPLPVNAYVMSGAPSNDEMAKLGVARISYGPSPYRQMVEWLTNTARSLYSAMS